MGDGRGCPGDRCVIRIIRSGTVGHASEKIGHAAVSESPTAEILDRVATGEEITLTRHGRAAAVMLRPDAVRARRGEAVLDDARRIQEMLDDAATRPLPRPVVAVDRGEEMVKGIRAERDRT